MLATLSAILKSVACLSGNAKHSRRKTKGTLSTAAGELLEVRQVLSGVTIGAQVQLGKPGDVVLAGDWNGDGPSSVFVRQPGVNGAPNDGLVHWYFDTNGDGVFESEQTFGLAGDQPVVGDWDGDGRDSVGVTRKSGGPGVANDGLLNWFLSTPTGWTHRKFGFSNDTPVVGNWNGVGGDDLGIVRPDAANNLTWMQDWNGDTMPERIFNFGWKGDQPTTGDWDGDGKDNVGVTRQSTADTLSLLLDTNHDPVAEVIGRIDLPNEEEKSAGNGDGQVGILAGNRQARPTISSGIDLRLGQLSNSGSPVAVSASLQNGEKITIFGNASGNLPISSWKQTLYSYGSESSHQIGRRERFAWTVNGRDTANRFMSSSRVVAKDSKQHTALFKLQVDNVAADNNRILTIDVYEADTGRVIAKREIRRKDFSKANWNQEFALDFRTVVGRRLEFRTFWHGGAAVKQERVLIR